MSGRRGGQMESESHSTPIARARLICTKWLYMTLEKKRQHWNPPKRRESPAFHQTVDTCCLRQRTKRPAANFGSCRCSEKAKHIWRFNGNPSNSPEVFPRTTSGWFTNLQIPDDPKFTSNAFR